MIHADSNTTCIACHTRQHIVTTADRLALVYPTATHNTPSNTADNRRALV